MRNLYVFEYLENEGVISDSNSDIEVLRDLIELAGHDTASIQEVTEKMSIETSSETLSDLKLKELDGFNPKEILFVGCKKPAESSRRFKEVREVEFTEVLMGLTGLTERSRQIAEEIVCEFMNFTNLLGYLEEN